MNMWFTRDIGAELKKKKEEKVTVMVMYTEPSDSVPCREFIISCFRSFLEVRLSPFFLPVGPP